jgi:hypothetical protein
LHSFTVANGAGGGAILQALELHGISWSEGIPEARPSHLLCRMSRLRYTPRCASPPPARACSRGDGVKSAFICPIRSLSTGSD